ncbi:MAG: gamma carbonic anhydrase family protein [Rhodospirillaceae bacterium]|jgi:gamma-carbonic anhydrase|nr:gamma carbonic anhydrase family protein [Rhodospirillaceae bacterium]MBT4589452.1 gamma carbonic anhydrase family protein [Rhodospirillaceae bacterium]MBT4937846.1 gamma carbonic anhydrase family protein [Rhodospirillaceae bacterium]
MSGLIIPYQGVFPDIAEDAFVAPNATIIGKVKIGAGSSIWFNTVLRGDVEAITVGERTSLQDGTIVHVTGGKYETHIGSDVLIGHKVLIHGATLEDGCFIGMSATVMDNVVVETGAMVAAGALVTPGQRVKKGELWAGVPAKMMRAMKPEEVELLPYGVGLYVNLGKEYQEYLEK